jgi:hypothetical protein
MGLYKAFWLGPKGIEEFVSFGLPLDRDYLYVRPMELEEVLMVAKAYELPVGEGYGRN